MHAIDLFSGAGGFTEGATQAGVKVVYAANHWPEAVEVHAANHPETLHACQDLHQVNWTTVPKHDLLLASPACQGHSRARGGEKPYHDSLRSTAWAVTSALEVHRPQSFIVENVPEFTDWSLFNVWRTSLEVLGYKLTITVQNAADFGVPQSRERIFVVGNRKRELVIKAPKVEHVPARKIINLNLEEGRWTLIDTPGRAERTLNQVRNGRRIHGDVFLLAYYGQEKNGRSIDKPVGTLTTNDRYAVVVGDYFRMFTRDEVRATMGFPEYYQLPRLHKDAVKMLGNAVPPPLAKGIIQQVVAQAA